MAFPVPLTSKLTGATTSQLSSWRRTGLLVPEISSKPAALYSFRDLMALRTVVKLRSSVSLQKIRSAFNSLAELDLTEHPSHYQLVQYNDSIALVESDGEAIDLVSKKHQGILTNLDDVFRPFSNFRGDYVADFLHPSAHLEVRERRLGGWPTIAHTRVPYDLVASLLEEGVTPAEVHEIYPTVTAAAAEDAGRFQAELKSGRPLQAVA